MALIEEVFETSVPGVIAGALATAVVLPMVGFGGRRSTPSDGAGNGPLRSLAKAAIWGFVTVTDKAKELANAEAVDRPEQQENILGQIFEQKRSQEARSWLGMVELVKSAQDHRGDDNGCHAEPRCRLGKPNTASRQPLIAKKTVGFTGLLTAEHAGAEGHSHQQRYDWPGGEGGRGKQKAGEQAC